MGIKDFNINDIRKIDKENVVVTLNDVQAIPSLSKYISLNDLVDDGKIYLKDYDMKTQNQIFKEFLIFYKYIDYIDYKYLFNYTRFDKYWHSNVSFQNIFIDKEPDFVININNETYKYYDIKKFKDFEFNYIGYLFMNQYVKIDMNKDIYVAEYDNFTDVKTDGTFEMEKNLKDFFITQLTTFLKMNYGDVFGFIDFGSNLQKLIQTKNIEIYYEAAVNDIKGFINDLNILFNDFIKLKKIDIYNDNYKLIIEIICIVNQENLNIQFVRKY